MRCIQYSTPTSKVTILGKDSQWGIGLLDSDAINSVVNSHKFLSKVIYRKLLIQSVDGFKAYRDRYDAFKLCLGNKMAVYIDNTTEEDKNFTNLLL